MSEIVALIVSAIALVVALAALLRVRGVEARLGRELEATKTALAQINRAVGREEGAAQERLIAAQATIDRAAAAALVLHPEPPAPIEPVSVVIVGQAEPVPVRITDDQASQVAEQVADRMAPDVKPEQGEG